MHRKLCLTDIPLMAIGAVAALVLVPSLYLVGKGLEKCESAAFRVIGVLGYLDLFPLDNFQEVDAGRRSSM